MVRDTSKALCALQCLVVVEKFRHRPDAVAFDDHVSLSAITFGHISRVDSDRTGCLVRFTSELSVGHFVSQWVRQVNYSLPISDFDNALTLRWSWGSAVRSRLLSYGIVLSDTLDDTERLFDDWLRLRNICSGERPTQDVLRFSA